MSFKMTYFEIRQLFMCHIEQTNCRATCLNLPDSIKQLVWLHATINPGMHMRCSQHRTYLHVHQ